MGENNFEKSLDIFIHNLPSIFLMQGVFKLIFKLLILQSPLNIISNFSNYDFQVTLGKPFHVFGFYAETMEAYRNKVCSRHFLGILLTS